MDRLPLVPGTMLRCNFVLAVLDFLAVICCSKVESSCIFL